MRSKTTATTMGDRVALCVQFANDGLYEERQPCTLISTLLLLRRGSTSAFTESYCGSAQRDLRGWSWVYPSLCVSTVSRCTDWSNVWCDTRCNCGKVRVSNSSFMLLLLFFSPSPLLAFSWIGGRSLFFVVFEHQLHIGRGVIEIHHCCRFFSLSLSLLHCPMDLA